MPSPSRWGPAAGYINVSAPAWVYEAVNEIRREEDWKTAGSAGLELIVEALRARGVAIPDLPDSKAATPTKTSTARTQRRRVGA